ncbi:hypothetical protein [Glutamicibacter sp. ZJUTW]|uniref:hypothetical protein n=1 Tax=Glutamicibacter sp. ZJUTW TaxID=1155384 RepID=UPI0005792DFE|nr:hypothetical protein [Glutamicibacter sp. ZJUTW]QEP07375.1 hypothetical protein F0M17_09105 [Glutamicibacter sp. ZJUTW]
MEHQSQRFPTNHEPLTVGDVLVDSLPGTLFTAHAPEKYMVAAVFNRRPEPEEIRNILSSEVQEQLASSGYADIKLSIANRRLEISNTSLEELRDGLAFAIACALAQQSEKFQHHQDMTETQFRKDIDAETERSQSVQKLAKSISFGSSI